MNDQVESAVPAAVRVSLEGVGDKSTEDTMNRLGRMDSGIVSKVREIVESWVGGGPARHRGLHRLMDAYRAS